MAAVRKAAAALRREERGFTLVELLIATSMGLVVVGAALTMFISGMRSEPRTAAKIGAIQEARVTLDRITRELRQSLTAEAPAATTLEVVTYVKAATCNGAPAGTSIPCKVTYDCEDEICTRTVAQPDGSAPGPATQVVDGLVSPNVFDAQPDAEPTYIAVDFVLVSGDDDPVTLGDGVALRNLGEEA